MLLLLAWGPSTLSSKGVCGIALRGDLGEFVEQTERGIMKEKGHTIRKRAQQRGFCQLRRTKNHRKRPSSETWNPGMGQHWVSHQGLGLIENHMLPRLLL